MNLERSVLSAVLWPIHRGLLRLTGGRAGIAEPGRDKGVGTLQLTTVGRRSGKPRAVPVFYIRDDARLVLVASNAGDDRQPAWFLNLATNPEVQAGTRAGVGRYLARTVAGEERERLWLELVRRNPGYKRYEHRTDREIPVVVLEPQA